MKSLHNFNPRYLVIQVFQQLIVLVSKEILNILFIIENKKVVGFCFQQIKLLDVTQILLGKKQKGNITGTKVLFSTQNFPFFPFLCSISCFCICNPIILKFLPKFRLGLQNYKITVHKIFSAQIIVRLQSHYLSKFVEKRVTLNSIQTLFKSNFS